jgi:hypothetical protein
LLDADETYDVKLKTKLLKVPYYVPQNYDHLHPIPDERVEKLYIRTLETQCSRSLNEKKLFEQLAQRAQTVPQQDHFIEAAGKVSLKSCSKIIKLLKKHPSLKLSTFTNNIVDL